MTLSSSKYQRGTQSDLHRKSSLPARKEVKLGFHHVNEETPDHVRQALAHFDKAIELEPDIADAWAGKASAYLTMTLHNYADDPERSVYRCGAGGGESAKAR